jgi:hypothetical protein
MKITHNHRTVEVDDITPLIIEDRLRRYLERWGRYYELAAYRAIAERHGMSFDDFRKIADRLIEEGFLERHSATTAGKFWLVRVERRRSRPSEKKPDPAGGPGGG